MQGLNGAIFWLFRTLASCSHYSNVRQEFLALRTKKKALSMVSLPMERIFGQPLANGFPTALGQLGVRLGHFNITFWLSALLDKRQCGTVRSKVKDGDIYNLVLGRRS